jgi:CubicO group peptidase (beta-lactamase class C family)
MKTNYLSIAFALAFIGCFSSSAFAQDALPQGSAERAGFSRDGLAAFDAKMKAYVDKNEFAGVVTMTARHGKLVHVLSYGKRDLAAGDPIRPDTIARFASMTKPIVGVAMMMLYEEGKWRLDDPIAKYIPEFKDLKVFDHFDKDGKAVLVAPHHAPTMRELMSHSAGFTYGFFGDTPVDKMTVAANLFQQPNLQGFVDKLATLPLAYQPGEGWMYSVSADVQGYIVEKLSGKPLGTFFRERIFEPLGMKDTGFSVPAEKLSRVSTVYKMGTHGIEAEPVMRDITKEPSLPSGGGGLFSTADDYVRFMQMMLNGGELDGKRLLKPETAQMMHTNQLSDASRSGAFGLMTLKFDRTLGFGLDFAITEDPVARGWLEGKGNYWWRGAAGTWFWIDPANDLVHVGIVQRNGLSPEPRIENVAREYLYKALVKPEK